MWGSRPAAGDHTTTGRGACSQLFLDLSLRTAPVRSMALSRREPEPLLPSPAGAGSAPPMAPYPPSLGQRDY